MARYAAFKVMTYNVKLANFGAPNPASRKPMIIEIIGSEAADIVGLQELGSTHRADIEAGLQDLYDFYDGQSGGNAELILLRKDVLAATGQGMVTLPTECGGSLGVTYLEVRSLRGVNFVVFNTHLCFNNPAQHAILVVTTDGTGQDIDVTDASVVENASQASDHIPITATLF